MIIAIDFDGVLCVNEFPNIGPPRYDVISAVRELIDMGAEVILWTTRNGRELQYAVEWCEDRGLHFCSINAPAPSNEKEYADKYPSQSRKIYADVYVDDHNLEYVLAGQGTGYMNMLRNLRNIKGRINQCKEN